MGKLGNLAFFNSVMTEMEDTRNNLVKTKQAKLDNENRNKLNDLKIKQAELDLETKTASGKADKFEAQIMERIIGDMRKAGKANATVADNAIEGEEIKQKDRMKGLIGTLGQGLRDVQENGETDFGASIPGMDVSFSKKVGPFTISSKKKKTAAEKFTEGFKAAELGQISFDHLEKQFPGKRKAIKEQRILGLPERSQRLIGQINDVHKAETTQAVKNNEIPRKYEETVVEFLGELVQNRAQAEKAGHDVAQILDIAGVTEQEVLDNQPEPKESFLNKIKLLSPLLGGMEILKKVRNK